MKNVRQILVMLAAAFCLVFAAFAAAGVARAATEETRTPEYSNIDELNGLRFGTITGTVLDQLIEQGGVTPSEYLNFNTTPDLVSALKSNKVDAFACDEPIADLLIARNEGITKVPGSFVDTDYGLFFTQGSPLVAEFDGVLERYWEDGTIEALRAKWVTGPDDAKTLTPPNTEHPKGTITMATAPYFEPMSYLGPDGQIVGYDIDLVTMICNELGYELQIDSYNMDAVVAAVQSNKADLGGTGTTITAEREEVVDFSEPTYRVPVVAVVRSQEAAGSGQGFFEGLQASIERTFFVEGRWKMVLSGLGVTALITLAATVFGTLLGFNLTFLRRKSASADRIVEGFQTVMSGLPVVVVLMILYYVVFGAIDISGVVVAILAFSLTFGAAASANIWNSIKAIDAGQEEAALALGYNKSESFSKVVLPQAAEQFLPLLLGQIVSLVKETSIVGYIAVQDLTRASDLIRSRTMEAFFPLIATAVIYFLICWLIRRAGAKVVRRYDPESKPRTIEGVVL